ncbi:MAG: sugar phosphate nucleotidyltransferase, partial [Bdellovibrionales bacterium]
MKTPFDPQAEITPVILAGGEGRRLRPLTSPDRPKPFLKLFGGRSLLQATALRCAGFGPPVVVCAKRYGGRALQDFDDIHVKPKRIVLEPVARSTAPALALAALGLDADAFMLVCPSDHVIGDSDAFIRGERAAGRAAGGDHIAFLAVRPDRAATRYGYIRCKPAKNGVHDVLCFTEKPDVRRAK